MEAKDLAQKWKEQEIEQKIKQQKVQTFTPQDYGICAAQKFAGEDEEFETRLALRAKLTAESIETQKNEILQKQQNEKLENLRYAQYEKYTATQRILLAQREAENERLKNIDLMKVNLQNANLRNQRQKQTCQEIKELEKMEILYKKNDPLLCETGIHDFKGFSRKDWQSSFDINQNLIQAKKQQQQQQKYEELSFHQTQSQLAQYEQNFEQQRIQARRQASLRLAQEYSQQAQLEAQRRRQKKIDSFGSISLDSGYLAGFGTSGR
uniref:RIB43A-like with coiled-coils protein 2 n=1 Tax=Aureoumbra lagunensis TaxID=44058 RepID=A0A7S3JYY1_9STRA